MIDSAWIAAWIAAWAAIGLSGILLCIVCLVCLVEILAKRPNHVLTFGRDRIHAWQHGEGCPVLYLHGDGANGRDFEIGPVQHLSDGFVHVLIDRPGYGYSMPVRGFERLATQAQSAAQVLDAFKLDRAVIAAHGEGAAVALRLALDRPDLVRALVLAAPAIQAPEGRAARREDLPAGPMLGALYAFCFAPLAYALSARARLRRRFFPQRPPRGFVRRSLDMLGARPETMLARRRIRRAFGGECALQAVRYPQIQAQAIILCADGDRLADPAQNGRALYGALRRAELVVMPGMGHMLHHKRAEAVAAAIRRAAAF